MYTFRLGCCLCSSLDIAIKEVEHLCLLIPAFSYLDWHNLTAWSMMIRIVLSILFLCLKSIPPLQRFYCADSSAPRSRVASFVPAVSALARVLCVWWPLQWRGNEHMIRALVFVYITKLLTLRETCFNIELVLGTLCSVFVYINY